MTPRVPTRIANSNHPAISGESLRELEEVTYAHYVYPKKHKGAKYISEPQPFSQATLWLLGGQVIRSIGRRGDNVPVTPIQKLKKS